MERREKILDVSGMIIILKKNLWLILLCGVVGGILSGIITKTFVVPQYQSVTKSMVLNQQDSNSITYSDFQSSTQFIEDYIEVIKSNTVLQEVIDRLQLEESTDELLDIMDVSIINETHILRISVLAESAEKAQKIAECITVTAAEIFTKIMRTDAVDIIDHAILRNRPVRPNFKINILLGVAVGMLVSVINLMIRDLMDDRIYTADNLNDIYEYPVVGTIPYVEMLAKRKRK